MPKGKKSKSRRPILTAKQRKPAAVAAIKAGILFTFERPAILARLLDTAIELWFADGDPLSIHVLAGEAHRNLDEIGHKQKKGPTMEKWPTIRDLYLAFDAMRHGNSALDFAPAVTEPMLLDAIIAFHELFGFRTSYMSTFGTFIGLHTRMESEKPEDDFFEGLLIKDVRDLSRQAFFLRMVPLFGRKDPTIARIPVKATWEIPPEDRPTL